MMKTNWSWIPSSEVNEQSTEMVGGVTVEVMTAYFDIPRATRFMFDEEKEVFVIDFKYLTDSEATKEEGEGDVVLHIGKKTKRIYQIRVKASALGATAPKKITFNLVVSADNVFKENIDKFENINKRNSSIVERCLSWGIDNKMLNLAAI